MHEAEIWIKNPRRCELPWVMLLNHHNSCNILENSWDIALGCYNIHSRRSLPFTGRIWTLSSAIIGSQARCGISLLLRVGSLSQQAYPVCCQYWVRSNTYSNFGNQTFSYDSFLSGVELDYVPPQTTLRIQCSTNDLGLVNLLPVWWLSAEQGALVIEDRHKSDPSLYAAWLDWSHRAEVPKKYLVLRFVLLRRIDPILSLVLYFWKSCEAF